VSSGFFITGTDTGVGKTVMTCALLHEFTRRGRRAVGMKPVAAGAVRDAGVLRSDDVTMLRAASNVDAPLHLVNPYCFEPPIAPHVAAERAGVTIDIAHIARAYGELAAAADVVIVEGVGGFCVPLGRGSDTSELARELGLPVILVVGVRLGCLSHALLTARAIREAGLQFAGWIANRIDPAMAAADENVDALTERLAAPRLGDIRFAEKPEPLEVAALLDVASLG
jgi:dethiobiotin synthetase